MMDNLVGQTLGRYRILAEVGRGGMAVVYKAHDTALDRVVALKVLAPHLAWDRQFVERFLHEARAVARLNHPHIVTIHDTGQVGDRPFIVMEFLEGRSLADAMTPGRPWPAGQVARWVAQIASALDYAHAQGIVHRDVKPGNIIVSATGHAKLTDFGLAKAAEGTRLTQTGAIMGTPAYMSPEQARGETPTGATDIYSLGVVAYELLAGRPPFQGGTPAVVVAHITTPPPPLRRLNPQASPRVEAAVQRALAKTPRDRYPSAGALGQALLNAVEAQPATAPARSAGGGTPLLPVMAAGLALLLILGLIGLPRLLGRGGGGGGGTPPPQAGPGLTGVGTPAATNPAATGVVATGEIAVDAVYFRSYPFHDPSTVVATLGKGTQFTVLGRTADGWLIIRTPIGQTGWVSGTYVSLAVPAATIPLVTPPSTPTGIAPPTASATASPPPATPSVTPTPTATPAAYPAATTAATATATCYSNLRVVAQQPAAGTFLPAGSSFNQVWTVQNIGTCNWTPDFQIVHEDGERFNGASPTRLGTTWAVGTQNTITVQGLVVPSTAGSYSGTWGLRDSNGAVFGAPLVVSINVRPPTAVPLAALLVTVQSPTNGALVSGRVPFRWWASRPLLEGKEIFDLRVCKGEGCRLNAVSGLSNTTATSGDWCMTSGEGLYRWQVWVIDPQTKQAVGLTSDIGEFNWTGGDCR